MAPGPGGPRQLRKGASTPATAATLRTLGAGVEAAATAGPEAAVGRQVAAVAVGLLELVEEDEEPEAIQDLFSGHPLGRLAADPQACARQA